MTELSKSIVEELQHKKEFVDGLSKAIVAGKSIPVTGITYEVWCQDVVKYPNEYREWCLVVYKGGAKIAVNVTADSEACILQEIAGVVLSGSGHYGSIGYYREDAETGVKII